MNKTGFLPQKNGFCFENRFQLSAKYIGLSSDIPISPSFGLCGGMCFAALDRFFESRQIETRTEIPNSTDPLFKELLNRQIATFRKGLWLKVYVWQGSPDISVNRRRNSIGQLTKNEWTTIKKHLDGGIPVTLCFICVKGFSANPTKNHQVIAYHYEERNDRLFIWTYDPNHPKIPQSLSFCLHRNKDDIDTKYSSPYLEPLRGFFPVIYDGPIPDP